MESLVRRGRSVNSSLSRSCLWSVAVASSRRVVLLASLWASIDLGCTGFNVNVTVGDDELLERRHWPDTGTCLIVHARIRCCCRCCKLWFKRKRANNSSQVIGQVAVSELCLVLMLPLLLLLLVLSGLVSLACRAKLSLIRNSNATGFVGDR